MPIFVGAASSSFANYPNVGVGTTTTTGRNVGVNTAIGDLTYNTDTLQLEVYDGTNWIGGLTSPFSATGGTLDSTSRSGFNVHTFTGDGTFVVSSGTKGSGEYLVIAGGGGAKNSSGGGGGAGGYRTSTSFPLTPGTYTIQVGGGGAGGVYSGSAGTQGTPSFITKPGISSITSSGGGYGDSGPGGSGGGGTGPNPPAGTGNAGGYTPPEGNDGGTGHTGSGGGGSGNGYLGAGGGGAGAVGGPAPSGTVS
jgi:hypothetical protein